MKLSEVLSKPIKLKGGGVLDLRGFKNRVIDKELESEQLSEQSPEESSEEPVNESSN